MSKFNQFFYFCLYITTFTEQLTVRRGCLIYISVRRKIKHLTYDDGSGTSFLSGASMSLKSLVISSSNVDKASSTVD